MVLQASTLCLCVTLVLRVTVAPITFQLNVLYSPLCNCCSLSLSCWCVIAVCVRLFLSLLFYSLRLYEKAYMLSLCTFASQTCHSSHDWTLVYDYIYRSILLYIYIHTRKDLHIVVGRASGSIPIGQILPTKNISNASILITTPLNTLLRQKSVTKNNISSY